jgi:hypothetical protein
MFVIFASFTPIFSYTDGVHQHLEIGEYLEES